ncbi:hypothetical protein [Lentzea sp. NPDC004782]|uniref:hypothetical protein n=1 Tax=Lentzea sp. NPDC004782 TaxID=3154458 RepID=UPI0033A37AF0
MTLALNVADPLLSGDYGKAAFDAVGPVLLIGWAEVGPGMLQSISQAGRSRQAQLLAVSHEHRAYEMSDVEEDATNLGRARQADARHWAVHKRPISADTLRGELKISMDCARELVVALRAELADLVVERVGGHGLGLRVAALVGDERD